MSAKNYYMLKHLKTCPGLGVQFPRDSTLQSQSYSDADGDGCIDLRRSIFGQYCHNQ
jgi:hypothetical protein